jgi:hypothetical protein
VGTVGSSESIVDVKVERSGKAPSTIFLTSSPMQSGARVTVCPRSSPMRSAQGARENLSSGPSLGRPK